MKRLLVLALASLLLVPAAASANTSFTGQTDQGRPIELEVADNGMMRFIDVSWRTAKCSKTGKRLSDVSTLREPFEEISADQFLFDRKLGRRRAGGVRISIDMELEGRRSVDPANPAAESWSGTVKVKAVVRKNGTVTDRCRLRSTPWSAAKVADEPPA